MSECECLVVRRVEQYGIAVHACTRCGQTYKKRASITDDIASHTKRGRQRRRIAELEQANEALEAALTTIRDWKQDTGCDCGNQCMQIAAEALPPQTKEETT